jgi:hypothetical protein
MNDLEGIWREKSDDDLIEAAASLGDYTAEGQQVIRAELKRRGLEDPVDQAGGAGVVEATTEVPPIECLRCHVELRHLGTKSFHEGTPWGAMGELFHLFENAEAFDVYVCPQCGHVDLFVDDVSEVPAES